MQLTRSKGAAVGIALLLGTTVWTGQPLADDDATEARDVSTFSRIVIEGAMDLTVQVGEKQKVSVTTDRDYMSRVTTEVEGDTLIISQEGRRWHDKEVDIEISVRDLSALVIEGAADAEVTGIDSKSFLLTIDGAGDVRLGGTCGDAEYEINGAGDIDARNLKCKTLKVTINGAGDADVYASEEVRAELNGVGDITVWGNPNRVRPSINGFGSFEVVDR